ncbi:MAG TPA: hypothetical protein VLU25_13875 [Acidobacteriota bacterium]|nr:hypothetical protein [Acidobacteriota bacterium]
MVVWMSLLGGIEQHLEHGGVILRRPAGQRVKQSEHQKGREQTFEEIEGGCCRAQDQEKQLGIINQKDPLGDFSRTKNPPP